jgi:hypothetical protein
VTFAFSPCLFSCFDRVKHKLAIHVECGETLKIITAMRNVPIVEKESLKNMIFPREEVLKSLDMARERRAMLERATVLSNLYHNKVKIVFEDREGSKMVDTTIWATTDSAIMLKGGVVIPIHRIHSIDLL